MLPANLTIGSETYNLIGNDLKKSLRARTADPEGVDQVLTISHDTAKINGQINDRHLVRLDYTKTDDEAKETSASAYLVINQPRSTAVTTVVLLAMCSAIAEFINANAQGNLTQVLNKEI